MFFKVPTSPYFKQSVGDSPKDFPPQGSNKTAGCSRNPWSNNWHLVFIIGNGLYIVKSENKGGTKWCSGCFVFVLGVSMVGFLVRFHGGAMYFFAIHMIEWHNM